MCFKKSNGEKKERRRGLLTVYCPKSGNKLMKCGNGTIAEVICPKCKSVIICKVANDRVETAENKRKSMEYASI